MSDSVAALRGKDMTLLQYGIAQPSSPVGVGIGTFQLSSPVGVGMGTDDDEPRRSPMLIGVAIAADADMYQLISDSDQDICNRVTDEMAAYEVVRVAGSGSSCSSSSSSGTGGSPDATNPSALRNFYQIKGKVEKKLGGQLTSVTRSLICSGKLFRTEDFAAYLMNSMIPDYVRHLGPEMRLLADIRDIRRVPSHDVCMLVRHAFAFPHENHPMCVCVCVCVFWVRMCWLLNRSRF
jgi:hypothetical protein